MGLAFFIPTSPEAFALIKANKNLSTTGQTNVRVNEISSLQQIILFDPWRIDVWEKLANLQFEMGNYTNAIQTYESAEKIGSLSSQSFFNEGKAWKALGEVDKAKTYYRTASEVKNQDVNLFLAIAKAQEEINDSVGTLATLLRAYGLDSTNSSINYALGVQFAANQPDNAVKFLKSAAVDSSFSTYSKALISAIDDSNEMGESANRYIYIGQELSQIGEWQAAASAFSNAIKLDAGNGIAWALEGEAVQHLGQAGYAELSKALALDPHSDIVNGLMAVYYRRQKEYDQALTYLYKALENNPNESTWQIEIGNTLALQGDLQNALVHFQVATISNPKNWVPWESLAAFCITYDYQTSTTGIDAAKKALLLVPGNAVLLDIMGSAYFVSGDNDDAERFYLEALKAAPSQAEILFHLGQLYLSEGKKGQAFEYLREAAGNATDNRIRDNANQLIRQNGGG